MTVLDPKVEGLKYEMQEDAPRRVRIKVVGVGGGGANAVAHMMSGGLAGVEFYVVNTDTQALAASPVPNKLAIGGKITNGRGAGGDPALGRQAALDETERLIEMLQGADMVFVAAGLGSGTGTGAAPVIAGLAKQLNAITVAVVTKPFGFEGARPMKQAEKGLAELAATVDTVIAVPNDRLLALAPRGTSVLEAFRMGHDLLRQTVQDIVEIIITPGLVNRDLSDIRATMHGTGYSVMGTALGKGENAALEAARQAISWPLLEGASLRGARDILVNITGSSRLGLHEVSEACSLIRQAADNEEVQVNFGIVLNEAMGDAVKLTVIATGFPRAESRTANGQEPLLEQPWPRPPQAEIPVARPESPEPPMPAPAVAMPLPREEPVDPDDWEKPAYLRQGKVLH